MAQNVKGKADISNTYQNRFISIIISSLLIIMHKRIVQVALDVSGQNPISAGAIGADNFWHLLISIIYIIYGLNSLASNVIGCQSHLQLYFVAMELEEVKLDKLQERIYELQDELKLKANQSALEVQALKESQAKQAKLIEKLQNDVTIQLINHSIQVSFDLGFVV